jgi:hypothetical protein
VRCVPAAGDEVRRILEQIQAALISTVTCGLLFFPQFDLLPEKAQSQHLLLAFDLTFTTGQNEYPVRATKAR